MLPRNNWCDNYNCIFYVLLQLDKVPFNVYGSFGHTPVIIYWRVDNYGYQLWEKYYYIQVTHPTMWNLVQNQKLQISKYAYVFVCVID